MIIWYRLIIQKIFTVPVSKNLSDQNILLQDEECSVPYDEEALEYLDPINFENADFDDNEIDYIEQSIQSSLYRWIAESPFCPNPSLKYRYRENFSYFLNTSKTITIFKIITIFFREIQ